MLHGYRLFIRSLLSSFTYSIDCVIHTRVLFVSTGTDNVREAESIFSPVLETEGCFMSPIQNFSID